MTLRARLTLLLRRLAAALYDSLLLLALWFSVGFVVIAVRNEAIPALTLWFELLLWMLGFFFYGWFWTHGSQTLGLRAWRLRAVRRDGGALGWPQALLRYVLALPSWVSVVGILWSLLDREGRTWHEIASASKLVPARQLAEGSAG